LFNRDSSSLQPLTEEQRWAIIILYKDGQKKNEIGHKISCSLKTVQHWISHYEEHQTIVDKPRSGRPRETDENTDVNIVVTASVEKFIVPKMIKRQLDLQVDHHTVRRRLDEAGLYGRISRREYPFTEEDIRKRLSFAQGYRNYDWSTVLYSDETLVELGTHGIEWVQRPVGRAFDPEYLTNKKPHPDRICVWACFAKSGVGHIHMFTEDLDATLLKAIFKQHLIQSAGRLFPENTAWRLLQDNDPKHRSKLVQVWLFNHGVQCIDFPPYSPDLNPIENLWVRVKRRVERHNPHNIETLQEHLYHEWYRASKRFTSKLSDSMPHRCQAVLTNKGHKTKY
jgi:transposase